MLHMHCIAWLGYICSSVSHFIHSWCPCTRSALLEPAHSLTSLFVFLTDPPPSLQSPLLSTPLPLRTEYHLDGACESSGITFTPSKTPHHRSVISVSTGDRVNGRPIMQMNPVTVSAQLTEVSLPSQKSLFFSGTRFFFVAFDLENFFGATSVS